MNKLFYKILVSCCLMLCVLGSSSIVVHAADAYIVYNEPNGFTTQASYMRNTYSPGATIYYVRSSNDFVGVWNSLTDVDNLIIMVHGGEGVLYFANEPGWNDYSRLNYLGAPIIKGNIMLLSCQGGTGGTGSVAYNLSKRTGSAVICAKNSAVNYNWLFNKNPDLDNKSSGTWARISAIRGVTYKCTDLGTQWRFNYLN